MEGLSSLDFRALFFPCSGSFSGAPASKATPFEHSEIKNNELLQQIGSFSSVYLPIGNFSQALHGHCVGVWIGMCLTFMRISSEEKKKEQEPRNRREDKFLACEHRRISGICFAPPKILLYSQDGKF